ncbi:phosphopyruvate hydratase [archaeon SCG-AAA382B04]|nr:phosphopyruvate hydratase [archaeon SCG-AAA382B04]
MTKIKDIHSRKTINSRGEPTIEIEVKSKRELGRVSSPSGASVGKFEATAFPKEGVDSTIKTIRDNKNEFVGLDPSNQQKIDQKLKKLDGTDNFSKLGGNGAIALSMATSKLAAKTKQIPYYEYLTELADTEPSLPLPLGNMIEGGEHAGKGATEIQEFLTLPTKVESEKQAIISNAEVHHQIKKILEEKNKSFSGGKGDEGGWVESLKTREALDILKKSTEKIEKRKNAKIRLGIDVAASEMWNGKNYEYRRSENKETNQQIRFMKKLVEEYNIKYLEDPLQEEDFEGFSKIKDKINKDVLICGDDLFVTNQNRIQEGINKKSANTVLIKPNQIGTLTDTIEAIKLAKENNYKITVSHRSGETTDTSIAHLAVATSEIIKCGAVNGERTAKLNELIRIEEKSNIGLTNLQT